MNPLNKPSGILLVNKPKGKTSFNVVSAVRRASGVQKVGHAGTLDPLATGVLVLLVGKDFTRLSDSFLLQDKEYIGTLHLGIRTDSYDAEGQTLETSDVVPSLEAILAALTQFQGAVFQTPPMFSAKKVKGKKLYELARKGIEVERAPQQVTLETNLLHYEYPYLSLRISCSKGTYIRSIAEDLGKILGCGAHLCDLTRTRSGSFPISECMDGNLLFSENPPSLSFVNPESILVKK